MFVINAYGQSGQDGNVSWSIADSTLTLTGTGAMKDYSYDNNNAPWHIHRALIKYVVVESGLTTIGKSAFALCSGLTTIEISDSVTSIGDHAFLACRNLTGINIPDSTKIIGALSFGACSSLTNIDIPNGVSAIGEGAFSGCTGLKTINIDSTNNTYKSIDGIAFSKDEKELLIYPAGNEDSLYIVPDHVTKIGYGVFLTCENIKKIEIQNGVTTIGKEAFYNCKNLRAIKIPGSVTAIGDNAFHYCSSLDTVEVNWSTPISINPGIYTMSSIAEATLSVPEGSKSAYEAANGWKNFGTIIERRVPTSNKHIDAENIYASYTNGSLIINSPFDETVNIYGISGTLVCSMVKKEGKITYPYFLSDGIYIVSGSSGWSLKLLK